METVALGSTGIQVTRLGIGLSEIGSTPLEVSVVDKLLNTGLDAGINFLDTAACYGNSEELVGMTVAHRRSEYTLASKCGHVAGGYEGEAWTPQLITDSIDRSLTRMKTDYVDLMQFPLLRLADLGTRRCCGSPHKGTGRRQGAIHWVQRR
jgi:aryl-alcohol dehydrogenase-like predicted oxidoreductase